MAILTHLRVDEVSLVKRGADANARVLLWKSADHVPDVEQTDNPKEDIVSVDITQAPEALQKAFENVEGLTQDFVDSLIAAFNDQAPEEPVEPVAEAVVEPPAAPATPDTTPTATAEVAPVAAPEPVAASAEVAKSEDLVAIRKRLEAAETELAKERENRGIRDSIAEVAKTYGALGRNEELGHAIYRMKKNAMTADDITVIEELLAVAARVSNELLAERGTQVPTELSDASPLERIAKGLMEVNPSWTRQKALSEAARTPEGAAAYEEYLRARSAR